MPRTVALFSCLVALAAAAPKEAPLPLEARRADFAQFVRDFADSYAYADRAEHPWQGWPVRYASAVDAAATPRQYAAVIAEMLAELHDFHAEVRSPVDDRWLPVPTFADLWAEPGAGNDARVLAVRAGSDAERAGLRAGDFITAVGGQAVAAAIAARLGTLAVGADDASRQWALLSLLAGRADEARRIAFRHGDAQAREVVLPVERHFDRPPGALKEAVLPGNIGYIRFNNSIGEQATVAAFDTALVHLRGTAALVLDLRDVPSGGDSSVALGVMGRFLHEPRAYQKHRIPDYGQADVQRAWLELVSPRGPFTYEAPLVVLADHWTGSMGEGMAMGFDAIGRAEVMGTPMAHLAGAVSDYTLPRTGVRAAWATEQVLHPDGTPRELWVPPLAIAEPVTDAGDALLEAALARLRARLAGVAR